MHAEIGVALFALGIEYREGREQAGADTGGSLAARGNDAAGRRSGAALSLGFS